MLQSRSYARTEMKLPDCRKVAYVAVEKIFTVTGQQCMIVNVHT
jgi:hypothetical protein